MKTKTTDDAIAQFLDFMKHNRCSPESIDSYASTLRLFFKNTSVLTDGTVGVFLDRYPNPATKNKVLGQLRSFANWGSTKKVPGVTRLTIRKYAKPHTIPTVIDDTDTKAFIEKLKSIDRQAWAVAILMRTTAMRIGEVFNRISESSYYEHKGKRFLKFIGKGNRERIVPLTTEESYEAFKLWVHCLKTESNWSVRTIRRRFVRAERQAGIRHLKPHWFRHTMATKLVNAGRSMTDISYLLGNTEQVVQNVYGRVDENRLTNLVEDALRIATGV